MKQRKKEHPILMCSEMVRAILAGTKTETRRMAGLKELNKEHDYCFVFKDECGYYEIAENRKPIKIKHPYGVSGDTLWVRETWSKAKSNFVDHTFYRADGETQNGIQFPLGYHERENKWRPSLHMPRWASRITLTVKSVTLERLHEITDEGARAEGVKDRAEYEQLWVELNGEESWDLNPWVWVVKFDAKVERRKKELAKGKHA